MKRRTSAVAVLFWSSAVAAAVSACRGPQAAERPARPVRVYAVAAHAPAGGLRYAATIQPGEQVVAAFKVGGYVRELMRRPGPDGYLRDVQQGDLVAAGAVLARLREAEYSEQVRNAKGRLAEADAGLEKTRLDYERARKLFEERAITRTDYDAAKAALDAATARSESARAGVGTADILLGDSAIVAPRDALVLSRSIENGSLVAPGTPAFTLADISRVKVVFGVPDTTMAGLRLGQILTITTEAVGRAAEFTGRITAISPAADPQTRVFAVELTIPNPERRLRPGMIAAVQVPEDPRVSASAGGLPLIPLSAVVKGAKGKDYAVFVVDERGPRTIAHMRPVALADLAGNLIAVSDGVKVGERVVVRGATLLADGDPVRVIP
jgi:multidrug efflux system membrane fusion protein